MIAAVFGGTKTDLVAVTEVSFPRSRSERQEKTHEQDRPSEYAFVTTNYTIFIYIRFKMLDQQVIYQDSGICWEQAPVFPIYIAALLDSPQNGSIS